MSTRSCLSALLAGVLAIAVVGPCRSETKAAAIPAVEDVLTLPVDGRIVIDKDGSVADYSISTPVPQQMSPLLDRAIRAWRFEPVVVGGAIVRAEAHMRLSLAATKQGEDYQVRIENAVFPPPESEKDAPRTRDGRVTFLPSKFSPPVFPRPLERAGVSGRVLLGLRYGVDGRVQDAIAVQSMLFDVKGRSHTLAKAIRMLEDAALLAARDWNVDLVIEPGEAPTAKQLTAFTTVEFIGYNRAAEAPPGQWRMVSRTPKRPVPWLAGEKNVQVVGVADVRRGEMLPLAGSPRLLTPLGAPLL
jgi:hypothetical protein